MAAGPGDSVVLEEELDPNYEPTKDEVLEYARWLGFALPEDEDLLFVAREGLRAPLPPNWKPCKLKDSSEIYFFNFSSGESTWDHPCDDYYRKQYEEAKREKLARLAASNPSHKDSEREAVRELIAAQRGQSSTASLASHSSTGSDSGAHQRASAGAGGNSSQRSSVLTPRGGAASGATGKPPLAVATPKSLPALSPLGTLERSKRGGALPSLDSSPARSRSEGQRKDRAKRSASRSRLAERALSEESSDDDMTRAMNAAVHSAQQRLGGSSNRHDSSQRKIGPAASQHDKADLRTSQVAKHASKQHHDVDSDERDVQQAAASRTRAEAEADEEARVEGVKRQYRRQQEAAAREHRARMLELETEWEQERIAAEQEHEIAMREQRAQQAQHVQRAQAAAAAKQRELADQEQAVRDKLAALRTQYVHASELEDLAHAVQAEQQRLDDARAAAEQHEAQVRQRKIAAEADARQVIATERERVDAELQALATSLDDAHKAHFAKLDQLRDEVDAEREQTRAQVDRLKKQRAEQVKALTLRTSSSAGAAGDSPHASPVLAASSSSCDDALIEGLQEQLIIAERKLEALKSEVEQACKQAGVSDLPTLRAAARAHSERITTPHGNQAVESVQLRSSAVHVAAVQPQHTTYAAQQHAAAQARNLHAQNVRLQHQLSAAQNSAPKPVTGERLALQAECDELRADLAAAQQSARQHAASLARVEALKAQLRAAQAQLTDATQAKLLLQDQHFQVQADLVNARAEVAQLQDRVAQARQVALEAAASPAVAPEPIASSPHADRADCRTARAALSIKIASCEQRCLPSPTCSGRSQESKHERAEPKAASRPGIALPVELQREAEHAAATAGPAALCIHHCALSVRQWCRAECAAVTKEHELLSAAKAHWRGRAQQHSLSTKRTLNARISALNARSSELKHVMSLYDRLAQVRDSAMTALLFLAKATTSTWPSSSADSGTASVGSTLISIESPAMWQSRAPSPNASPGSEPMHTRHGDATLSFNISRSMAQSPGARECINQSNHEPSPDEHSIVDVAAIRSAIATCAALPASASQPLSDLQGAPVLPNQVAYYVQCTRAVCSGDYSVKGSRCRVFAADQQVGPQTKAHVQPPAAPELSPVLPYTSPSVLAPSAFANLASPSFHSRSPAGELSNRGKRKTAVPQTSWLAASRAGALDLANLQRQARIIAQPAARSARDTVGMLGMRLEQRAAELATMKQNLLARQARRVASKHSDLQDRPMSVGAE